MLSFKRLEAIFWVAKLGTFSAAAERLFTSESAISKRISELESFLGVELFDRSRRKARLTQQGIALAEHAEDLLQRREKILVLMGKESAQIKRFRVGVTELIALTWLPKLVQLFRESYPSISFEPEIDLSPNLYDKMEQGLLDMVIIPEVFDDPRQVAVPLKKLQLTWMCRPELISEEKSPLSFEDMARYPILVQLGRSGVDLVYEAWFRKQQVKVKKVYAGNSLVSLAALTVAGFGISYLPTLYFQKFAQQNGLCQLELLEPIPDIPYYAVYPRDNALAVFNAKIAEFCVTCCDFGKPAMFKDYQ